MESDERIRKICKDIDYVRRKLKSDGDFIINPIDLNLPVVPPFIGNGLIKLIILGQDPTIKNITTRANITCTLNLDKNNSLQKYIARICDGLGVSIENVYATNLFKYFYSRPPAMTFEVLNAHLEPNLELLKEELSIFENLPVLTLGEPVMQLLTNENNQIRVYWDYNKSTGMSEGNFSYSQGVENNLNRDIFPFPHQPSLKKVFYNNTINDYLNYLKTEMTKL